MSDAVDVCRGPRPRLFWYPEPLPPFTGSRDAVPVGSADHARRPRVAVPKEHNWRFRFLRQRLRDSPHHEADGRCADFFLISNHEPPSTPMLLEMFRHIARAWPHWNRTAHLRGARHLLLAPCDHGPGDCGYDRSWTRRRNPLRLPRGLSPADNASSRRIGFLTPSGSPGPFSYFVRGVDIRLPQDEEHSCGPFCGVPQRNTHPALRAARGLENLRRYSPWAIPPGEERERRLAADRPIRFLWAGHSAGTKGFRGGMFTHHRGRPGFLLHDTSAYGLQRNRSNAARLSGLIDGAMNNLSMRGEMRGAGSRPGAMNSRARAGKPESWSWLARAMSLSEFCYSPPGQHHGDSDRYLPSILFGCIPVFVKDGEEGPFEELIPWGRVSLMLGLRDVPRLHEHIANCSPARRLSMRRSMASVWPRLLWARHAGRRGGGGARSAARGAGAAPTWGPSSYLGESGEGDAFETLIDVLRMRLRAWEAE